MKGCHSLLRHRTDPLNKLPPSARKNLAMILDMNQDWREVAARLTRRGSTEPLLDTRTIMYLSDRYASTGGLFSPTEAMLTSWSTMQPKIEDLIKVLQECRFLDAAKPICELVGEDVPSPYVPPTPDRTRDTLVPAPDTTDQDQETALVSGCAHTTPTQRTCDGLMEMAPHYNYNDLLAWTNNFDERPLREGGRVLGCGGFGKVYLGTFRDTEVAIKKLANPDNTRFTSIERQFLTEVAVLSRVKHVNVVGLVGYSQNGTAHCIIYSFMVNGSLQDRLECKDSTPPLPAAKRVQIAQGVARGIHYLHTFGDVALIHRDIKSANVLLDADFTAKLGDCGLAHLGPERPELNSHTRTALIVGSQAYMAPEYFMDAEVSVKTDAYAYGIVLLELLTALPAMDSRRCDAALGTYIQENVEDIHTVVEPSAGPWSRASITAIYNMSQKFLRLKRHRPTISESMSEINSWTD